MRKVKNTTHIEGKIYNFSLAEKKVQKQGENFGKDFINGTLEIATDDDNINVVSVHYSMNLSLIRMVKRIQSMQLLRILLIMVRQFLTMEQKMQLL